MLLQLHMLLIAVFLPKKIKQIRRKRNKNHSGKLIYFYKEKAQLSKGQAMMRRRVQCSSCKQLQGSRKKVRKYQSLSLARLLVTPWTAACLAPLTMGFSRQGYWNGLPFPSPEDLPNPGIEPRSRALQADSSLTELPGRIQGTVFNQNYLNQNYSFKVRSKEFDLYPQSTRVKWVQSYELDRTFSITLTQHFHTQGMS